MFTIAAFVDALTLEQVGDRPLPGDQPPAPTHGVVFGGQLLAQSVMAGLAGQEGKSVKTIHTVFARRRHRPTRRSTSRSSACTAGAPSPAAR